MSEAPTEILVVEVGAFRYGIALKDTHELFHAPSVVPLPRAPAIIEGVIDVRGKVVPVLDIRKRFGLADKAPHPSDHIVLAQADTRTIALRVDRALSIARLNLGDIDDARDITPATGFVAGVAKLPDGLVLIYDLKAFMDESEALELADALRDSSVTSK